MMLSILLQKPVIMYKWYINSAGSGSNRVASYNSGNETRALYTPDTPNDWRNYLYTEFKTEGVSEGIGCMIHKSKFYTLLGIFESETSQEPVIHAIHYDDVTKSNGNYREETAELSDTVLVTSVVPPDLATYMTTIRSK